ncbi:MAG: type IV secretion system DNA-binding domain-containing protein [Patescibacteria group bacterium]
MLTALISIVIAIVLGFAVWYVQRWYTDWLTKQRAEAYAEWRSSQRYTVLKVLPPKNNDKTPLSAEQMFAALHGIFRETATFQDEISFELASHDKFIHFYVHVPIHLREFVEGQIYAQYPSVEIYDVEDYAGLGDSQPIIGGELVLTKDDVYPIQTFPNFTVDPLSGITGVLSTMGDRQQIWIQIVIKPVSESWQEKGIAFVAAKRLGVSLQKPGVGMQALGAIGKAFVQLLGALVRSGASSEEGAAPAEAKQPQLSAPEEAALKAIETKVTKLGYETKIRILVTAPDPYTARSKVEAVTGAFKQFSTTNMNGFKASALTESHELLQAYRSRQFGGSGMVMNTEELASLYHLPAVTVETPNVTWAGSKKGEPPSNLPMVGQVDDATVTFFGTTDFRNFRQKFGIKAIDRRLHMYAIGKTGTGKSTLLHNMIVDDINKGRGVAVVDPHGQLVQDVLGLIPANRIQDVVYFNPADRDFPIGFNLLENVNPDLRNVVASGAVGIFKKLFAESWGPRLEYILRNAILALLEYPDSTLLGINRLLTDKAFRKKVTQHISDPVIKDYFENEFERYDPKFRTEAIAPIQNKVGQFLSSSTIRNIVGQPHSALNIREIMDSGKILLMDLSIGRIGEDSSALLGAMLITQIQLSAMGRADVSEDKRPDFYLYVDEFQNFATDSFAVILSEARKYHLNLVLTNQYIAQMPETVSKAIFGNVGTIVSFRVGPGDASGLVKEFEPVFESVDLVNLDNHHIYVKMAIDGVTRPAFSATTLPPQQEATNNLDEIVKQSRDQYAQPRELVEQRVREWSEQQPAQAAPATQGVQDARELTGASIPQSGGGVDSEVPKKAIGTTPKPPLTDQDIEEWKVARPRKNTVAASPQSTTQPSSEQGRGMSAQRSESTNQSVQKKSDEQGRAIQKEEPKPAVDLSWFDQDQLSSGQEISFPPKSDKLQDEDQ